MNPGTLLALLAAIEIPRSKPAIRVMASPKFTRNLFGPLTEIAGKTLELLERNPEGDCLCLFTGVKGQNIVDVDHRDVEK